MRKLFAISIALIAIFSLAACSQAENNPSAAAEHFTVGILNITPRLQAVVDGFIEGMGTLGYVEGETITYVYPENDTVDNAAVAQAFVEQNVDLIMTVTNGSTEAALAATETIPVIAGLVTASVESGYAESLAHPGGNYTAVDIGPVTAARFQLLMEMFPDIRTVYVPLQAGYTAAEIALETARPIAEEFGVELLVQEFTDPEQVLPAIAVLPEGIDAIFTLPDPVIATQFLDAWAAAAIERGIPHSSSASADLGPLFSYGADFHANGVQAARLADQVLQGANPGELPIETGAFFLVINLQTAEAAGLEIPDSVLSRADEIIRVEE